MNTTNKVMLRAAIAAAVAVPLFVHAESTFLNAAGALSATAHVDFQITIPKVLFLQVGTGSNMATNAAIDLVSFTVPAASLGNGTAVAATSGGDLGNGIVTAKVVGNNGDITLTSSTAGALTNGAAGDTISFTQINTTAAFNSTPTTLAAPALADGAVTSTTVTATNKVVNQDAKWTYTYKNQFVQAPGTYGGAGINNGRVTYTASMP
ncbi:MAG TPA: hypothetical protein VFP44_23850 [Usitatibacter sp.]|nr:hypothetical protein [Usitatibacter sp.]